MIRSRLGALACAVLTTVAVGACARPAPQAPPPADAGVALPGDFGGSGPGTLLKATTLPLVDRRLVAASSIAARITYTSTSGITGQPTNVTGTVFAPNGKPPEGGWPVIAFGHPTTGIQPGCAPSLSPTLAGLADTVLLLVKAGYVVAMSDFQGLGDPGDGYHPYLDAKTAAYNLVDSARAARKVVSTAADRWVAFGTSQGAQGAWAANEFAGEYGEGMRMLGSVSMSPPLDVTGLVDAASAGTLTPEQVPAYLALVATYGKEDPAVDLDEYRRGVAAAQWDLILGCDFATADQRTTVLSEVTPDDVRPASPAAAAALRDHLAESRLPLRPTTAPALVIYGGQDALILPAWTDAALARACALGDVVDINLQPDKGHSDVDVSSALPWVADRFADAPAPNSCPSFVAPAGFETATGGPQPEQPQPDAVGEGE